MSGAFVMAPPSSSSSKTTTIILVAAVALGGLGLWWWWSKTHGGNKPPGPSDKPTGHWIVDCTTTSVCPPPDQAACGQQAPCVVRCEGGNGKCDNATKPSNPGNVTCPSNNCNGPNPPNPPNPPPNPGTGTWVPDCTKAVCKGKCGVETTGTTTSYTCKGPGTCNGAAPTTPAPCPCVPQPGSCWDYLQASGCSNSCLGVNAQGQAQVGSCKENATDGGVFPLRLARPAESVFENDQSFTLPQVDASGVPTGMCLQGNGSGNMTLVPCSGSSSNQSFHVNKTGNNTAIYCESADGFINVDVDSGHNQCTIGREVHLWGRGDNAASWWLWNSGGSTPSSSSAEESGVSISPPYASPWGLAV